MRHTLLRPTQDMVAKKIFQNLEVTKAFISDILDLPVLEVELLDGHQIRLPNDNLPKVFYTVTDILVKLDDGTQVIIEIQIAKQKTFVNRLWAYICTQVHDNIEKIRQEYGQTHFTHERIYPVYGIALLEKNYFEDAKPFHVFSLREEESNKELTVRPKNSSKNHSLLKMAFLELEKYQPETISDYDVKKWFEFFGNRNFTIQPDQIISQAEHALDFTTWTKEEQDMWDKQLDSLEVSYATLVTAKEEGFEEGFEKGREEGREATYLQLVRRLVQKGMTDNEIVELTDLPLSTIIELRQQSMV
ncbi:Rpn family recombination-promoting nuclease/putative transposase [Streptococcus suis]|uniref:Rpn family recombination-promoting nuclease/putative transposase n=1 Tax=Streptococcus suis TaxID=1307 RepID=UPI0012903D8C|nr:Rpn family recombination-promoting nuclease/putative transposase [Streptococcus suis]